MKSIAVNDMKFPKDAAAKIDWIGRDAGGGWQGGHVEFRLSASQQIVREWRAALESDTSFDCRRVSEVMTCGRRLSDNTEGVAVEFDRSDAARITKWAIT